MSEYIQMKNITKVYPPNNIIANNRVNFSLLNGEIHAIVGENGAGKSTLMKILYGEEQPDGGIILLQGRKVSISDPITAKRLGIGMVHQEFKLFPNMTATENIILGREPRKCGIFFHRKKAENLVKELSVQYGLTIDPAAKIGGMSVGQKQRIELLKMLYCGSKILILDEPTAVLVEQEVQALFKTLQELSASGHTIVLITHKIPEVISISDRVSVMRAGRIVATEETSGLTEKGICDLMMGSNTVFDVARPYTAIIQSTRPVLQIENLSIKEKSSAMLILDSVSFDIHGGEVFGIAGVAGNGQTGLIEAIFGLRDTSTGIIRINSTSTASFEPKRIRELGVAYVPGERTERGAALQGNLWENILVFSMNKFRKGLFLDAGKIRSYCDRELQIYGVKAEDCIIQADTLSGGNLQKIVICREIKDDVKLLIIEEPTRGLDVRSAHFVHEKILMMRCRNCAVLVVSSDLHELLLLSDRLAVMYRGRITKIMENEKNLDPCFIGEYMMGLKGFEGSAV